MEPNALTDAQVMQVLSGLLSTRTKALPSATPGAQNLYGEGGLFAEPGIKDPVISAISLPQQSIARRIPSLSTMYLNEVLGFITEAAVGSGSEPDGVCDDPPVAGNFKTCLQTLPLGRVSRQSQVFDISSSGLLLNRGITNPLGVVGGTTVQPFAPAPLAGNTASIARSAYQLALESLAIALLRKLGPLIYTGNPTNNTANGGYKEFKGLAQLINTGYVDSVTSTACAALDSDVRDFASANISTDPNGATLVQTLTNMYRNAKKRAEDTGLAPARWFFAMRWSAFMEITEVWPCVYASYRCAPATGSTQFISATDQMQMRDQMRNGTYLLIDGERVPVQIDDFITETQPDAVGAPNDYLSDIWLIPETFAGNRAATYMEFVDFGGPNGLMAAAQAFGVQSFYRATDGGRWAIHNKPPNNWCVQLLALTMPRLVLLTPHLAGRLQNVRYSTIKHEVSSITTEASYVGGGVTSR
jgi:hypothetical protein